MELSEEEKKVIEDSKELINELGKHKDKDFIGRVYYKNKPIEDTLMLLLNIIDRQQKEIKKEKSRIMELAELLDKQENEINSLQQELEVQKGCSISKDKIRKYLNSLKYWEDNNTSFLESKGEIFLNKAFIINIFEDLLKES